MIAMLAVSFPLLAHAGEGGPSSYPQFQPSPATLAARYSPAFDTCIDKSGGVTAAMQDCLADEYELLDETLNTIYAKTMRHASTPQAKAELRSGQREWLSLRWNGCLREMESAGGGSASDLVYRDCQLREVARRSLWLEQRAAARPGK